MSEKVITHIKTYLRTYLNGESMDNHYSNPQVALNWLYTRVAEHKNPTTLDLGFSENVAKYWQQRVDDGEIAIEQVVELSVQSIVTKYEI